MRRLFAAAFSFVLTTSILAPVASAAPGPVCAGPRVVESSLSHAVENRHAVAEAIGFEPGDTVYALAVVENRGPKSKIDMFWKRDGVVRSKVTLDVGSAKGWRTWSKHTMRKRDGGAWTVEVRAEDGTLLENLAFEVATSPSVATVD